jgi:hypothetical protein
MRANVALQRILTKQIQSCMPGTEIADARRCAATVLRSVKVALQLDDVDLDGLMHGSMAPRVLVQDEFAARRFARVIRRMPRYATTRETSRLPEDS